MIYSNTKQDKKQEQKLPQISIYVPEDWNVEKILPKSLRRYEWCAKWIVGIVYWNAVMRFSHAPRNSEFSINLVYKYLREILPCKKVLSKIMYEICHSGALVCDYNAIPQKKAYSYKLGHLFNKSTFRVESIKSKSLLKSLSKWNSKKERELTPNQQWLYSNLQKVKIDYEKAIEYANYESNKDLRKLLIASIDAIHNGIWLFKPDDYGRIHTNLTNLSTDLRQFLIISNQDNTFMTTLSGIDIRNSQPLFLSLLISKENRYNNDPTEYKLDRLFSSNTFMTTLLDQYRIDCENGEIYDKVAEKVGRTRKEVKTQVLRAFYLNPRLWERKALQEQEPDQFQVNNAIKELYPQVWEYTLQARSTDYERLAQNMQREEGYFMFNQVIEHIRELYPEKFVATIHDSLVCRPEDLDLFEHIMMWEFANRNTTPKLKREERI